MTEVLPHEDPSVGRWSAIQAGQQDVRDKTRELEHSFVRAFGANDGQNVLAYLRSITIDRTLPATCTDAELRWVEAQRALVRHITTMIERGRTS